MDQSHWPRGCDLDGWSLDEGPKPRRGTDEVSFHGDVLKGNIDGLNEEMKLEG